MDRGVLVLTTEAETEAAVASAIGGELSVRPGGVCRTLQELVTQLRLVPAPVAVVDLDLGGASPERMLSMLDPVISHFGQTRFVAVARNAAAPGLLTDAMHVGARHLVAKTAIGSELASILKRMAGNGSLKSGLGLGGRGMVVAVLSAGGGCGATLLAVNLANELHVLTHGRASGAGAPGGVLLVDMDAASSAVGVYLGLESQYGLNNVLADGERMDGELIRSTTAIHDQRMHVLLNSGSRGGGAMRYEHLPRLLEAARSAFDYTVMDAPRLPADAFQSVAAAASGGGGMVIVPFQQTVIGIRAAKGLLDRLAEAGCHSDHILPVADRFRKRRTLIGLDEAAKALRVERDAIVTVRNDFRAAVESLNFGQPLAKTAARSKLRADIQGLAARLHRVHSGEVAKR